MNKSSIEWTDYTWNPVTGCKHGCPYCYARKIAERFRGGDAWPNGFDPMFHPERMDDPQKMKKPQTIFVCSMADLFGDWVPYEWQHRVFDACMDASRHTYIFLTKNPRGMEVALARWKDEHHLMIDENAEAFERWWFGVSDGDRIYEGNYDPIVALRRVPSKNLFISFEPLLIQYEAVNLHGIKQVIIGAQTNPSVAVTPEMVQPIGAATSPGTIAMFCKDSMPTWAKCRRELCWSLHK